uniref:Uncharacterized protein n=1 Tax=Salmo trutta TaxID=8032 RepID=A0A673ZZ33_SALTR
MDQSEGLLSRSGINRPDPLVREAYLMTTSTICSLGSPSSSWAGHTSSRIAVLSVYMLAGQMALHCHESGMDGIVPQFKECVGGYVERVICPEIRDKGGWVSSLVKVKNVCCWTLLLLVTSILSYFLWKQKIA